MHKTCFNSFEPYSRIWGSKFEREHRRKLAWNITKRSVSNGSNACSVKSARTDNGFATPSTAWAESSLSVRPLWGACRRLETGGTRRQQRQQRGLSLTGLTTNQAALTSAKGRGHRFEGHTPLAWRAPQPLHAHVNTERTWGPRRALNRHGNLPAARHRDRMASDVGASQSQSDRR